MRIVGLGNCQTKAITGAMRLLYPSISIEYFPNTSRVGDGEVSVPAILEAAERADVVLAQAIMNRQNPLALSRLREVIPRNKLVGVPYVYLDGLFSMTLAPTAPQRPYGAILGSEIVEQELERQPLPEVLRRFRAGEIDFKVQERLAASSAEMKRREKPCAITILPVIEQKMRNIVVMETNNHPSVPMLQAMLRRLARHLNLRVPEPGDWTPDLRAVLKLPVPCTVVTPRDAETLGFTYPIRPTWQQHGERLIRTIAADVASRARAARISPQQPPQVDHEVAAGQQHDHPGHDDHQRPVRDALREHRREGRRQDAAQHQPQDHRP